VPGTLGGNRRDKIYGRLDCPSALRAVAKGPTYSRFRVFFLDEASAIAAGYRPCGNCMKDQYRLRKQRTSSTGKVVADDTDARHCERSEAIQSSVPHDQPLNTQHRRPG
jgi:methylphosphotriester-DNA--protein-cysteine methyltransferase